MLEQIVNLLHKNQGPQQAVDYLLAQLEQSPSLRGLKCLTELYKGNSEIASTRVSDVLLKTLDSELSARPAYSCKRCGFAAKTLHWQCPGCRSWGTIKPSHDHDQTSLSGVTV